MENAENMENAEWHERRKSGLGGSDAPVACGISPWRTPFQLYLEKRGEGEAQPENEYMRWGKLVEPIIRQRYSDLTGMEVAVPKDLLVHPKYPWMIANPDGLLPDRVLEIKASRTAQGWGDAGTDEIPEQYLLQVTHYMSVTGRNLADVAVLIGGSDFRVYTVELDPELEAILIDHERRFWEGVEKGEPPPLETYEDALQKYRQSKALVVQASEDVAASILRMKQLRDEKKAIEKQEEALKTVVVKFMEEADTLALGETTLATWRTSKPVKRFNSSAFKEKYPHLYEEFLDKGKPTRRFLLK